jgi:hypothetical protein
LRKPFSLESQADKRSSTALEILAGKSGGYNVPMPAPQKSFPEKPLTSKITADEGRVSDFDGRRIDTAML